MRAKLTLSQLSLINAACFEPVVFLSGQFSVGCQELKGIEYLSSMWQPHAKENDNRRELASILMRCHLTIE